MGKTSVSLFDRIWSCVSYLTAGWGGVIVMFIMYIQKKQTSRFLRFNAMQSIFIALLLFVLFMGMGLIAGVLKFIPFVNHLVAQIAFLINRPLIHNWSILQVVLLGITSYMALFSLLGKYPRLYFISKIVDYNAR